MFDHQPPQEGFMSKAGSPELRKLLRRLPGYSLDSSRGSHSTLIGPDGQCVRSADGRPVKISSSPRNASDAAKAVAHQLRSLGIEPRRAA
jgi:hypothetical protein